MSDTSDVQEGSKAVQEVAKLGTKVLDTADKAVGFLAMVFKESLKEVSGIISDKLRFVRLKRLLEMESEVQVILTERGISQTRAIPPKIAVPLLENASLEDDGELRAAWNELLVNALNPNFNEEIRYAFIEMLKNITGTEAVMLGKIHETLKAQNFLADLSLLDTFRVDRIEIIRVFGISAEQYAVSAHNLMRLQLIAPAVIAGGAFIGDDALSSYKGIDVIYMTALGVKFVQACIK